jgi:hypothetical protein
MRKHTAFVVEATEQHPDLPTYDPRRPRGGWLHRANGCPHNFLPDPSIARLRTADDAHAEYVRIIRETLANAAAWLKENHPDELPEEWDNPEHVVAEMANFAPRWIKGYVGEILASDELKAAGYRVLTTEEALEETGKADVTAMEKSGIDLVTADGQTWQVKNTAEPPEDFDADNLIWIDENGDVRLNP